MPTPAFNRLAPVSFAANAADQLAIAAVPLALTAAGATPATLSAVVAAQAAAWFVVSLPAGVLADRLSRRRLMLIGALVAIIGAALSALILSGLALRAGDMGTVATTWLLALGVFLLSGGIVVQILSVFALMPQMVQSTELGHANARLEFVRAISVLGAPILAARFITLGLGWVPLAGAVVASVIGFAAVARLPADAPSTAPRQPVGEAIRDGAAFVAREPILRAITLCALAWNPAFVCLLSMFAPYATRELGLSIEQVGYVWGCYGAGALLGALSAPTALARVRTGTLFWLGPLGSFVGVLIVVLAGPRFGMPALLVGFFLTGFTPMIWLVMQTSVRQLLTPPDYLGRVAATITAAIYGIRPVGAFAAGLIATWYSPGAAMWLATALFGLSLLAIVVSPAMSLNEMPRRAHV